MKITVDYDFMTKSEIKITPIEYYLSYNKNHYKRSNILVNSNDTILTFEYKENDETREMKYYKNKFGSFLKYLRYDSNSNMNYELSSFDRVVIYNKNYTIFLEKPFSAKTFVRADILKKSFKNTYKNVRITFKKPIELQEIKNINFDNFTEFNVDYNTLLVFDIDKNIYYGVSDDFDFKSSFKIDKQNQFDLNNAFSISSPFFEPSGGKDIFNLIHGFNN
jgi:hypothetical protein